MGDGNHSGMLEAPIQRDCVKALHNVLRSPEHRHAELTADFRLGGRRGSECAHGIFTEDDGKGAVVEFSGDHGAYPLRFKPVIQRASQIRIVGGQQKGHALQAGREASRTCFGETRMCKEAQARSAQEMAVRFDGEGWIEGASDRTRSNW
jgi:hypothetical protein